jgi:hypothetical protein
VLLQQQVVTWSWGRGWPLALLFLARAELESSFGFFTVNGWSCGIVIVSVACNYIFS